MDYFSRSQQKCPLSGFTILLTPGIKKVIVILVQLPVLPLDDAYAHTYVTNLVNFNLNLCTLCSGLHEDTMLHVPFVVLSNLPSASSPPTLSHTFSAVVLVIIALLCHCRHIIKLCSQHRQFHTGGIFLLTMKTKATLSEMYGLHPKVDKREKRHRDDTKAADKGFIHFEVSYKSTL